MIMDRHCRRFTLLISDEDKDGEKETYNRHKIFTDKEIGNLIDMVMAEDDFDNDGYITYPEFAAAQRRSKNQASKS